MKRFLRAGALALIFALLLTFAGCFHPADDSFELSVKEFNKRGNVQLDTTFEALKEKNVEPGDMLTVTVGKVTYDIPVGTSYSDVDSGDMLCRFDLEDEKVFLAINGGSFAETAGMATKETVTEDPGYRWDVHVDTVTFRLKEKRGYMDEYTIRNLARSNERNDYSDLSDADFANCRAIATTGLKENVLFRGTTPLSDALGRNVYAMTFLQDNDIGAILNLADTVAEMTAFAAYQDSYYASASVWNAEMDYQFTSASFAEKVKDCVLFILEEDGPYYIHCKEGKDRTGILCAILECFLGATAAEVEEDYMKTYENFYRVQKTSDTYEVILNSNLRKTLKELFAVTDLATADLKAEATEYLLSAGLSAENLSSLTAKLGASEK